MSSKTAEKDPQYLIPQENKPMSTMRSSSLRTQRILHIIFPVIETASLLIALKKKATVELIGEEMAIADIHPC